VGDVASPPLSFGEGGGVMSNLKYHYSRRYFTYLIPQKKGGQKNKEKREREERGDRKRGV